MEITLKNIGKKGSIGPTITWIAATLIIFFIMIIFLVFSGAFALDSSSKPNRKILLEQGGTDIFTQKNALSFLNKRVDVEGQEMSILELILLADKDKSYEKPLIDEVNNFVNSLNPDCYFVRINDKWDVENIRIELKKKYSSCQNAEGYLDRNGNKIILNYQDQQIKAQFYLGECKYEA